MGRASAVNRFTLWCFFDFFWTRGSLRGVGISVSVRKKSGPAVSCAGPQ